MGIGFNVFSMLLGCVVGVFFVGWFVEWLGCCLLLFVVVVFFFISVWGLGVVLSSGEFVFYCIIGGLVVGVVFVMVFVYIVEVLFVCYWGMFMLI